MATPLSTLTADTLLILNENSVNDLYSTDLINLQLNNMQVQITDGQKFSFLRSTYSFLAPVKSSLTSAITTASTTIAVGATTNWATSGAVWINGDLITYTGKTSTTVTGVTGISIAHSSGDVVYPLVALPSDFWSTPDLRMRKNVSRSMEPWTYVIDMDWYDRTNAQAFTIIHNGSTGYLMIDETSSSDQAVLYYQKYPTYMTTAGDENATIPDPYARFILPTLAASQCLLLYGDDMDGLGTKLMNLGNMWAFKMGKHYGQSEDAFKKIITSHYKSRIPQVYGRRYSLPR